MTTDPPISIDDGKAGALAISLPVAANQSDSAARKPRRRMKMSDALRAQGVDELRLAETYQALLERSSNITEKQDVKLLLEIARDCAKILEPPKAATSADPSVQLIHHIPRPDEDGAA